MVKSAAVDSLYSKDRWRRIVKFEIAASSRTDEHLRKPAWLNVPDLLHAPVSPCCICITAYNVFVAILDVEKTNRHLYCQNSSSETLLWSPVKSIETKLNCRKPIVNRNGNEEPKKKKERVDKKSSDRELN